MLLLPPADLAAGWAIAAACIVVVTYYSLLKMWVFYSLLAKLPTRAVLHVEQLNNNCLVIPSTMFLVLGCFYFRVKTDIHYGGVIAELLVDGAIFKEIREHSNSNPIVPTESIQEPHVHSFCEVLTASNTSTHSGFSVLQKYANEAYPSWEFF
ncbi:hypothetical protein L1887_27745 [Cichorium endivia]|nr:hypothetical protein L1887_27745 [Cichorium endivia]